MSCRSHPFFKGAFHQEESKSKKQLGRPYGPLVRSFMQPLRGCWPAQGRPMAPPAPGRRAQRPEQRGEGPAAAGACPNMLLRQSQSGPAEPAHSRQGLRPQHPRRTGFASPVAVALENTMKEFVPRPAAAGRAGPAGTAVAPVAGSSPQLAALPVLIESRRDERVLQWLIAQAGPDDVATAVSQLAGARRPYLSNVCKLLGLVPPAELAKEPADPAVAAAAIAKLQALLRA